MPSAVSAPLASIGMRHCLLEREQFVQARLDAVRAATLLAQQPNASKEMLLFDYEVGERAWSKVTAKAPE